MRITGPEFSESFAPCNHRTRTDCITRRHYLGDLRFQAELSHVQGSNVASDCPKFHSHFHPGPKRKPPEGGSQGQSDDARDTRDAHCRIVPNEDFALTLPAVMLARDPLSIDEDVHARFVNVAVLRVMLELKGNQSPYRLNVLSKVEERFEIRAGHVADLLTVKVGVVLDFDLVVAHLLQPFFAKR